MAIYHFRGRASIRASRCLIAVFVAVFLLSATFTQTMAASQLHHKHHRHHGSCAAMAHNRLTNGQSCSKGAAPAWVYFCRHNVRCAAHHLYLHPHFGLRGQFGRELKPLPEGKWIRRFVIAGAHSHVSPRILMAIGLIESYGGTGSPAYMGCLKPSTYRSWPKQIGCAIHVIKSFGLAGYDPDNPSYPETIREHAHGIVIRSR